jgi:hypothetical protein
MAFSMVDNFCKTNGLPRATHHSVRSKWFVQMHALRPPTRDLSNCRNTRLCCLPESLWPGASEIRIKCSNGSAFEFPCLKNESSEPPQVTAVINLWGMRVCTADHLTMSCLYHQYRTIEKDRTGQMSARNPFCGRSSQSLHVAPGQERSRHPGSQNMAASPTGGIGWNQVCTIRSAERFWCGLAHRNNLKLR